MTLETLLMHSYRVVPLYEIAVTPQSAPRQTATRFPSKYVMKYRHWRNDFIAAHWKPEWELPEMPVLIFGMPMPKSWSGKKRERMNGTPHTSKPDTDNLTKCLIDSIYGSSAYEGRNDSEVWSEISLKFWSYEGYIKIGKLEQA